MQRKIFRQACFIENCIVFTVLQCSAGGNSVNMLNLTLPGGGTKRKTFL